MSAESSASSPADRIPRKEGKPNKVLLFTIIKPDYPITVRVLLAVCKKFNCAPVKIYIFRRRGVQAMVEFDDLDTATYVKSNLDGADIYSGCCTLKIEFARVSYIFPVCLDFLVFFSRWGVYVFHVRFNQIISIQYVD